MWHVSYFLSNSTKRSSCFPLPDHLIYPFGELFVFAFLFILLRWKAVESELLFVDSTILYYYCTVHPCGLATALIWQRQMARQFVLTSSLQPCLPSHSACWHVQMNAICDKILVLVAAESSHLWMLYIRQFCHLDSCKGSLASRGGAMMAVCPVSVHSSTLFFFLTLKKHGQLPPLFTGSYKLRPRDQSGPMWQLWLSCHEVLLQCQMVSLLFHQKRFVFTVNTSYMCFWLRIATLVHWKYVCVLSPWSVLMLQHQISHFSNETMSKDDTITCQSDTVAHTEAIKALVMVNWLNSFIVIGKHLSFFPSICELLARKLTKNDCEHK